MLLSKSNNNEWNSINNVNLNSRIYSCTLGLKIARSANFVHNKPFCEYFQLDKIHHNLLYKLVYICECIKCKAYIAAVFLFGYA